MVYEFSVWNGEAGHWYGKGRYGLAGSGEAWFGRAGIGMAVFGAAWRGRVW